jgi:hypothetical protein
MLPSAARNMRALSGVMGKVPLGLIQKRGGYKFFFYLTRPP